MPDFIKIKIPNFYTKYKDANFHENEAYEMDVKCKFYSKIDAYPKRAFRTLKPLPVFE